jgi:hypothetical protein
VSDLRDTGIENAIDGRLAGVRETPHGQLLVLDVPPEVRDGVEFGTHRIAEHASVSLQRLT